MNSSYHFVGPFFTRFFSPFIELFEKNHPLNGRHAARLTCDGGFISRDWKSFFFILKLWKRFP